MAIDKIGQVGFSMEVRELHKVNFYERKGIAILDMAHDVNSDNICVLRESGPLQIWHMNSHSCYFIQNIFLPTNLLLDALSWTPQSRLFASGASGELIEIDTKYFYISSITHVMGGSKWCMQSDHTGSLLAIGSEEGIVSVYNIRLSEDLPKFVAIACKQAHRIVSLSWHPEAPILAVAYSSFVSVYKLEESKAPQFILLNTCNQPNMNNNEVHITCITFIPSHSQKTNEDEGNNTDDSLIVCADSKGRILFWNYILKVLIQILEIHEAPVFSLTYDTYLKTLYSAGADPIIYMIKKIQKSSHSPFEGRWMKSFFRNVHTHDVTKLISTKNWLISAGFDGEIGLSRYPPCTKLRFFSPLPPSFVHFSEESNLLLLTSLNEIQGWSLGICKGNDLSFEIEEKPKLLYSIKAKKIEAAREAVQSIRALALTKYNNYIAYADGISIHIFFLQSKPYSIQKIGQIQKRGISSLKFYSTSISSNDDDNLICCDDHAKLFIINNFKDHVPDKKLSTSSLFEEINMKDFVSPSQISIISQKFESYFLIGYCTGELALIDVNKNSFICYTKKSSVVVRDIQLSLKNELALVLHADNQVYEFHISPYKDENVYKVKERNFKRKKLDKKEDSDLDNSDDFDEVFVETEFSKILNEKRIRKQLYSWLPSHSRFSSLGICYTSDYEQIIIYDSKNIICLKREQKNDCLEYIRKEWPQMIQYLFVSNVTNKMVMLEQWHAAYFDGLEQVLVKKSFER